MTPAQLNCLYAAYCADPERTRDDLLKAIQKHACEVFASRNVHAPDDLAQEFTLDFSNQLSTLKIHSNFSACVNVGLRYAAGKYFRKRKADIVRLVDSRSGEEELDLDEELSRRAKYPPSGPDPDFGLVKHDPELFDVLNLLVQGYNQTEIAERLGIDRQTVRRRLDCVKDLAGHAKAGQQEKRKKSIQMPQNGLRNGS